LLLHLFTLGGTHTNTCTHAHTHKRDKTSLEEGSTRHRDLCLTTQTLTEDIHVASGIRTCNFRKRAAADPHLRLHGQWDRAFRTIM